MKRPSRLVREWLGPKRADAEPVAQGDNVANIIAFGEEMLRKNALDPAYAAVHGAELPLDQVKRLVLAYCLFYHLGLAAYLSEREGAEYWRVVEEAARNDRPPCETDKALTAESWPRVADRRHFRGPKCVEAVQSPGAEIPPAGGPN